MTMQDMSCPLGRVGISSSAPHRLFPCMLPFIEVSPEFRGGLQGAFSTVVKHHMSVIRFAFPGAQAGGVAWAQMRSGTRR